jgi:hypothetical protein
LISVVCNSSGVESRYYFGFGLESAYDPTEAIDFPGDGTRNYQFFALGIVAQIEQKGRHNSTLSKEMTNAQSRWPSSLGIAATARFSISIRSAELQIDVFQLVEYLKLGIIGFAKKPSIRVADVGDAKPYGFCPLVYFHSLRLRRRVVIGELLEQSLWHSV